LPFEFLFLAKEENGRVLALDSPLLDRRRRGGAIRPTDFEQHFDRVLGGGPGGADHLEGQRAVPGGRRRDGRGRFRRSGRRGFRRRGGLAGGRNSRGRGGRQFDLDHIGGRLHDPIRPEQNHRLPVGQGQHAPICLALIHKIGLEKVDRRIVGLHANNPVGLVAHHEIGLNQIHHDRIGQGPGHPVGGEHVNDVGLELRDPVGAVFIDELVEGHPHLDDVGDPAFHPVGLGERYFRAGQRQYGRSQRQGQRREPGHANQSSLACHSLPPGKAA